MSTLNAAGSSGTLRSSCERSSVSGTVASNLRYGNPDATDQELWAALEVAQAREFVAAMPGGLEALIVAERQAGRVTAKGFIEMLIFQHFGRNIFAQTRGAFHRSAHVSH